MKGISFFESDLLLVEQDSHVLHATSISATTSVLAMSADSTVTHGHVSSHMSNLPQSCDLRVLETVLETRDFPFKVLTISKIVLIIQFANPYSYILYHILSQQYKRLAVPQHQGPTRVLVDRL